jgi:hypothetical protein
MVKGGGINVEIKTRENRTVKQGKGNNHHMARCLSTMVITFAKGDSPIACIPGQTVALPVDGLYHPRATFEVHICRCLREGKTPKENNE